MNFIFSCCQVTLQATFVVWLVQECALVGSNFLTFLSFDLIFISNVLKSKELVCLISSASSK